MKQSESLRICPVRVSRINVSNQIRDSQFPDENSIPSPASERTVELSSLPLEETEEHGTSDYKNDRQIACYATRRIVA